MSLIKTDMITFILLAMISLTLISCGDASKQEALFKKNSAARFNRLTKKEQQNLAPNDLFKSIFLEEKDSFFTSLNSEGFDFSQKNGNQETALVVAIKQRKIYMVDALLEKATKDDFTTPNKDGRSYFSLFVEYDLLESFDKAYNTYRSQAQIGSELWLEYADFKDDLGRRASFYAKSYAMIDKLENAWFSSFTTIRHYFNSFYFDYDESGNSFLHLAAQNQNIQVINWYIEKHCSYNEWESSSVPNFLFRRVGDFLTEAEFSPFRRRFINIQNNEGNTPLHLAARKGRVNSINTLLSCYQTDPTLLNNEKRAPITELLKNIDPSRSVTPVAYKESFNYLLNMIDPAWYKLNFEVSIEQLDFDFNFNLGNNFKKVVTKKDQDSWTAVHYASKIIDPHFWNAFKKYQKIETKTLEGFTPRQLRGLN